MFRRKMTSLATPITDAIRSKVRQALSPTELDIQNDSHLHAHHAAMRGSANAVESHFRLRIVSSAFAGKPQPERHRMVYNLLKDELQSQNGIHALQMSTKTPEEVARAAQKAEAT